MGDFFYYWKRYRDDVANGLRWKLNQNAPLMREIRPGDTVWLVCRPRTAHYAIAAQMKVSCVGRNALTDPDFADYGEYFFIADPAQSRYFVVDNQRSCEDVLRTMSLPTSAKNLGMSFQGNSGVRRLSMKDAQKFSSIAQHLKLLHP